jgi:hypothetical protein
VTKTLSSEKPTINDLRESLVRLKTSCTELGISKLAMPKIAAGRDQIPLKRFQWLIRSVFSDTNMEINVYILPHITQAIKPIEITPSLWHRKSRTPDRSNDSGSSFTPRKEDFPVVPAPRKKLSIYGRRDMEVGAQATTGDAPVRLHAWAASPALGLHLPGASPEELPSGESKYVSTSENRCTVEHTLPA